jgi:hypothetical protein
MNELSKPCYVVCIVSAHMPVGLYAGYSLPGREGVIATPLEQEFETLFPI